MILIQLGKMEEYWSTDSSKSCQGLRDTMERDIFQ